MCLARQLALQQQPQVRFRLHDSGLPGVEPGTSDRHWWPLGPPGGAEYGSQKVLHVAGCLLPLRCAGTEAAFVSPPAPCRCLALWSSVVVMPAEVVGFQALTIWIIVVVTYYHN